MESSEPTVEQVAEANDLPDDPRTALQSEVLRTIVDCGPDPILTISIDGTIRSANAATARLFGYTMSEMMGRNVSMLMPEPVASEHNSYLKRFLQTRQPRIIGIGRQVVGRTKAGVLIPVHLTVAEGRTANDHFFTGFLRDIGDATNARKALEAENSMLEGILSSSVDGIVVADSNGVILRVNKSTISIFGYDSEQELIGENVSILTNTAVRRIHDTYIKRYLQTGERKVVGVGREVSAQRKDGRLIPVHLALGEAVVNDKRLFTAFFTDLSQMKKTEKAKAMFLANMSHEIRTPMNGVFGMLSLLKESRLSDVDKGYLDTCFRSAESLLTVLNDILLFSKADANAIELERVPFNINEIVEDVLHVCSASILNNQNIDITSFIHADVPLSLFGDPSRLRQILMNLVGNAVKFTQYGEVSLEVSVASKTPLCLRFEIIDTGIGISPEQLQNLFHPFSQADETMTRRFGGVGLGLAICKKLVDLFSGELTVQSRLGRGSTFSFTAYLDRNENHGDFLNELGMESCNLSGHRILMIDDNATNCLAVKTTFERLDCYCATAQSGPDGIDQLRAASLKGVPFEIVLLDYNMPRMNGIDVARAIANSSLDLTPSIIALSSSLEHRAILKEPNICLCLTKPLRRGQLVGSVYAALSGNMPQLRARADFASQRPADAAPVGVTVLVAEDNDTNMQVVVAMLQQSGVTIIQARNGVEAVERMTDNVGLVLMDVHMPIMDGISAARLILQRRPSAHVVFLTADVTPKTREECLNLGAADVLLKPVRSASLTGAIQSCLLRQPGADAKPALHCLIVDDEDVNQLMLRHFIERFCKDELGSNFVFAGSGLEAVGLVEKSISSSNPFHLILMDVNMPLLSGIKATELIRECERKHNVEQAAYVIGVTGFDDRKIIGECRAAGMDDILNKPYTEEQLKHVVSPVLNRLKRGGGAPSSSSASPVNDALHEDLVGPSALDGVNADTKKIILTTWKSQASNLLSSLRSAVEENDLENVSKVAHTLKGSNGQVGAIRASKLAAQIEKASAAKDSAQLTSLVSLYEEALKSTFEKIKI